VSSAYLQVTNDEDPLCGESAVDDGDERANSKREDLNLVKKDNRNDEND